MINRKDYQVSDPGVAGAAGVARDVGLWFVLGSSLLLSLAYCPPFDRIVDDKEFFKYTGMVILKGGVPYRDFFDHKPPLIYFINAAGLLFGTWGLWAISAAMALGITYLFYQLCRKYRLGYPWVLPFLFNLMVRDNLISGGMHFTREYSTFFVMFFFITLMGRSKYRYFLLGLFAALTFFTQQDQVLLLAPLTLCVLFEKDQLSPFNRCVRMGVGFLSIAAALVLYFAVHRSLSWFWQDAYGFNFSWYLTEKKSFGDHFRTIKRVLDHGNYELPFMIALVLGVTSLFLQNRRKDLVAAAILAVILSMSSELMGGRLEGKGVPQDFNGYFLPLSAAVCMLLFIVVGFTEDRMITDRRAQLPFALLLCTSLTYTQLQHGTHLERRKDEEAVHASELAYLRGFRLADHQLFIMLDEAYGYYYNELKVVAPTPWVYQQFWLWYANWDSDQHILRSIGEDLLRYRTTFILMDPQSLAQMRNPVNIRWWMSFLREHYDPVTIPGHPYKMLWKLKETQ